MNFTPYTFTKDSQGETVWLGARAVAFYPRGGAQFLDYTLGRWIDRVPHG